MSIQVDFYQPIKFAEHIYLTKIQIAFILIETENRKTISIPKNLKGKLNQKASDQNNKNSTSSIQIYT